MSRGGSQAGCIVLCATGLCVAQTQAAEWQATPSAYVGSSYADNPRLLADGGTESSGTVGEFSADLKRSTERSEFSLRPRVRSARYKEDESLDSDDQFVTGGYTWIGERSEWNSELSFTRDTTLTSELGSTGLVQSNRRREATNLLVAPQVMFTERVRGGAQLSLSRARYIDAESTGLVDYRYESLSLFSTVALSDAGSSLSLTAQGGELSTQGFPGTGTRDATLRLSWTYHPWQLWTVGLSAGPSWVETNAGSDQDWVFDADIKRQGDRWWLTASGGRTQSPTGRGVLARRDEVELSLHRRLTERLTGNIGARWIRSQDSVPQLGAVTTYEVDYGRVELGASWRWSRDWSLALQLAGQTQEYEIGSSARAEGYRAVLSIVWNGQPQSL
ncbi:MAG: hypothetical protein ABW171_12800 [Steroidobacter sp.]